MRLYHGTSDAFLGRILCEGLLPRRGGYGNWDHTIPSNERAVYLTSMYSIHYAKQAASIMGGNLLLLEIEVDMLDARRLCPDEDFLAQLEAACGDAPRGSTLNERTEWYRDSAELYRDAWMRSVKELGTCSYYGEIPPATITRYAVMSPRGALAHASDPTVTLQNCKLLGGYYRQLTRHVFGDEIDINDGLSIMRDRVKQVAQLPRSGVMVVDHITGEASVRFIGNQRPRQLVEVTRALEKITARLRKI